MVYRPNVCAVVIDPPTSRVLVCRRVDPPGRPDRWQFPQGGVQPDESPRDALFRELEEEIGTARLEVLAQAPDPIRYDIPAAERERLARIGSPKARFQGQEQTWFLLRLLDGERSISFAHEPREFNAFEWVAPEEALARVVPFKAEAYRSGLCALGLLDGEGQGAAGDHSVGGSATG